MNFIKNGTVNLYIYDSYGLFEEIRFKVGNYKSYYPSSVKVKVSGKKAKISSAKNEKATGYGYTLCDKSGNIVKPKFSSKTSRTFEKLSAGSVYDAFAQNKFSKYIYAKAQQKPVVIKPQTVTNFDFIKDSDCVNYLSWNSVRDATGYQVMTYNAKTKKYTKVATVPFGTNGYTISKAQSAKADKYAVRAYSKYDGTVVYGNWSDIISLSSKAPTPTALNFTDKSTKGFTLNWKGNKMCDGYEIYIATPEKPEPYYYKTIKGTSMQVSGFKKLTLRKYKIRSFINTEKGKIYSAFTPLVSGLTLPSQVKGLKLSSTSSSVTVSWSKHADADYYRLYYKPVGSNFGSMIVNGTSHTFTQLSSYTDFAFYVTAVSVREGASSESLPCDEKTVRTLPAVPQNLKVTKQGFDSIDLSWDKNAALDFYTVSCYDAKGKVVVTTQTQENFASIKGLSPLTSYSFKITGGKRTDELNVNSDYSAPVASKTILPVVENYKASKVTEKTFRLSWDKIEGADYYSLYYKKDGKFKLLGKTKKTSCTVKAVPKSSKGYFYLTASYTVGGKRVEGGKTKTFTASVKPSKVTGIITEPTATTVNVKWNKVKNATSYRIYLLENGEYVLKKSVKSSVTSARIKKLKDGTKATVSVVACIKSTLGTAQGEHVNKSFYTKPHNITKMTQTKKTDTSYTLKWEKPSDSVNRYYLYRIDAKTGELKRIATTKKTGYTVKGLTPGTSQRYTVMATIVKNGKVVSKSEKVCDFECSTYLSKPNNLTLVDSTETSVTFKWDKVKGATSYKVYYYNAKKKSFKLYKEVEENTATVNSLTSGKEYVFRVKAVKETKKQTFSGYSSSNLRASAK